MPANVLTVHGAEGVGVTVGVPVGVLDGVDVGVPLPEAVGLDDADAPTLGVGLGVGENDSVGQMRARSVPDEESAT